MWSFVCTFTAMLPEIIQLHFKSVKEKYVFERRLHRLWAQTSPTLDPDCTGSGPRLHRLWAQTCPDLWPQCCVITGARCHWRCRVTELRRSAHRQARQTVACSSLLIVSRAVNKPIIEQRFGDNKPGWVVPRTESRQSEPTIGRSFYSLASTVQLLI